MALGAFTGSIVLDMLIICSVSNHPPDWLGVRPDMWNSVFRSGVFASFLLLVVTVILSRKGSSIVKVLSIALLGIETPIVVSIVYAFTK
jgi:hypothetical protein